MLNRVRMPPAPLNRLSRPVQINLLLLGLLVVAMVAMLWPHWRQNPDLSHGWFMPALFLLLLHESRGTGPHRWLPRGVWRGLLQTALMLTGLGFLAAAGLYATSVGWSHAVVLFSLTAAFVALLGAGLVNLATTETRVLPFNWIALVAIGLWLLCAPIPPGTYSRLTLTLQLWISEHVLSVLHLLGIVATRNGNIIELANVSVGVEEACSGVRSLLSCVFAGFFFSASLVQRPWARVLIVLLAAPLALGMNFLRSLLLTLLANGGVDIAGTWHDITGFAVLGITAAILAALALLLEKPARKPAFTSAENPAASVPAGAARLLSPALTLGLLAAFSAAGFFYLNTRSSPDDTPAPDLLAILPEAPDGWAVRTSEDLYQFSSTLRTEHLAQRSYFKTTPQGIVQVTVYLAYWKPGQSAVSAVASHTPDACWPGSGWAAAPVDDPRVRLSVQDHALAPAEVRLFHSGEYPQYVWFWHLFDQRPLLHTDPYSWRELLRLAWRYGFRRDGEQLFVRISSNQPWDTFADDALFAEIFQQLRPHGL